MASLLGDADAEFAQGVYDASKLIAAWSIEPERTSQLAFYIGRCQQYSGNIAEARKWYDEAAGRTPAFPWIFYERSEIHEQEGNIKALANDVLRFLKSLTEEDFRSQLNSLHRDAVLRKGHQVFLQDVSLSRRVYSAALDLGVFDYLSILRIVEGLLDEGKITEADHLANVLQKHFKLDAFGLLAISRLLEKKDQRGEAVKFVEAASDMLPGHFWLRGQVCVRFIELGEHTKAKAAIHLFGKDPRFDVEEVSSFLPTLQFRLAVRERDIRGAITVVQDLDHVWSSIETWIYAEAVYTFARHNHDWSADEKLLLQTLMHYLLGIYADDAVACLAVLHYYTIVTDWDEASNVLGVVKHTSFFESRDMLARRFEVACHMQNLAEARRIYEAYWQNSPSLNQTEIILSMRLLSELKDWQGAADEAANLLTRGMSLPEDSYNILLTIRRAGQHQRFINIIERSSRTDRFVQTLKNLIVDDLCILRGTATLPPLIHSHRLTFDNCILLKPREVPRLHAPRSVGFICSDRAYFVSVLTLIASLATNVGRDADWYLFLSKDVPESWVVMLRAFCACINFEIKIVPEEDFFIRNEGCITDYGLFSAGRHLARSAYFRIYAADWLLKNKRYSRAVYMDSDIICQSNLDSLFALDLGGEPVSARPEENGTAVVKAALKCGVPPEDYINSGVLVFDFRHPALAERLHDAIWQSENALDRLTFHDQCALNIAFASAIKHLPEQYNTFLRPYRTYDEELQSGVLLHYLDRPKPWDTGFKSSHRGPWMMAAAIVKALVPSNIYQEVVAAGIGQALVSIVEP